MEADNWLEGSVRDSAEVDRILHEITERASANASGEVGVGLSIRVSGEVRSIGATTPGAKRMDNGQVDDGDGPCLRALHSGESVAVTDYTGDSRWPGTSRRAAESGIRSSLSLPLRTRDDFVLGALNVYSDSVDAFSVDTGASLGAFAAQATTSLFLLGELQEERDESAYVAAFSQTVQEQLRAVLPVVPGMEMVGGSIPSASRAAVGGDWYDALVLPDGAVGLVIGDVMGHDIEAVAAMAQLRTMVRAGAWLGHAPDQVLAMADELIYHAGLAEIATAFYGRLTRTGPSAHLEYCNAGHLRPLLRDADGAVTTLDGGTRLLLGTLGTGAAEVSGHNGRVEMAPGSILLLYTDGLVEGSGLGFDDATENLVHTLSRFDPSAPLAELCQGLLQTSDARDDTTVFAVRI
jgi:serine phosphatase RsbU (regulator of sigma subunit)